MKQDELILIIDFGAQYTQLIARRVREANVYSEIHSHLIKSEDVRSLSPAGIILSGGPMSVYDEDSPQIDPSILKLGILLWTPGYRERVWRESRTSFGQRIWES